MVMHACVACAVPYAAAFIRGQTGFVCNGDCSWTDGFCMWQHLFADRQVSHTAAFVHEPTAVGAPDAPRMVL